MATHSAIYSYPTAEPDALGLIKPFEFKVKSKVTKDAIARGWSPHRPIKFNRITKIYMQKKLKGLRLEYLMSVNEIIWKRIERLMDERKLDDLLVLCETKFYRKAVVSFSK